MKFFFAIMFTAFALQSQASELTKRHLSLIAQAVQKKCHIFSTLHLESEEVEEDRIDQGVRDYHFTSLFSAQVEFDQGQWDNYEIDVQSSMYSGYDHTAQDWGLIQIHSVECRLL
jgi:hypothetical protein